MDGETKRKIKEREASRENKGIDRERECVKRGEKEVGRKERRERRKRRELGREEGTKKK